MTVYVSGNSHIGALYKGYLTMAPSELPAGSDIQLSAIGSGAIETTPFSELTADGVRFTSDEYQANLVERTGLKTISSDHHWGFCMGTHNSRIYINDFWRKARPNHLATAAYQPVSDGLLTAIIEADQQHIKAFFAQLKQAGVPLFVVSCPYPKKDIMQIVKRAGNDAALYIDTFARKIFKNWLDENDIDFIEPPEECCADDGFLIDEYAKKFTVSGKPDPHHANEKYGQLMMKKIYEYIAGSTK